MTATAAADSRARARALVDDGRTLESAGDVDAALEQYERAIAADADYLPAYEAAVPLWVAREDFGRVVTQLERVTLRNPRYAFAWYSLAYAYRRLQRPSVAVSAYEAYIELRPGEPEPYFGLGAASAEAGDADAAIAAYRRYVELEVDPDRARYVQRARDEIARLERVRIPPGVWLQRSRAAAVDGRLARAFGLFARAMARAVSAGA